MKCELYVTDEKTKTSVRIPLAESHFKKNYFCSLFQQGQRALALPICRTTFMPNLTLSLQHEPKDRRMPELGLQRPSRVQGFPESLSS